LSWRRVVAVVVLAEGMVAAAVACTMDFDHFNPVASANGDSSMQGDTPRGDSMSFGDGAGEGAADAGGDGACTPAANCLSQATTCGAACSSAYQQCLQGCSSMGCRMNCKSTEQSCNGDCQSTCYDCTNGAGCGSFPACVTATRAGADQ
jgi:hypothetical protein